MKILPIDNRNSFKGAFVKSALLDKTFEYADVFELRQFREHLKLMKRVDDKREFHLTKSIRESFIGKDVQVLLLNESNHQRNSSYTVGTELNINDTMYGDNCYINALKKINNVLNVYYPVADNVENKSAIINDINNYLSLK